MSPTHRSSDAFIPQDTAEDDSSFEANTSQPLGETDIEELLYGGERPSGERLELLRALRDDIAARQSDDLGDDDPRDLVGEIDGRIAELEGAERQGEQPGAIDIDPLAHRETLAPDSDELEALDAAEDASLDEEDEEEDEKE